MNSTGLETHTVTGCGRGWNSAPSWGSWLQVQTPRWGRFVRWCRRGRILPNRHRLRPPLTVRWCRSRPSGGRSPVTPPPQRATWSRSCSGTTGLARRSRKPPLLWSSLASPFSRLAKAFFVHICFVSVSAWDGDSALPFRPVQVCSEDCVQGGHGPPRLTGCTSCQWAGGPAGVLVEGVPPDWFWNKAAN